MMVACSEPRRPARVFPERTFSISETVSTAFAAPRGMYLISTTCDGRVSSSCWTRRLIASRSSPGALTTTAFRRSSAVTRITVSPRRLFSSFTYMSSRRSTTSPALWFFNARISMSCMLALSAPASTRAPTRSWTILKLSSLAATISVRLTGSALIDTSSVGVSPSPRLRVRSRMSDWSREANCSTSPRSSGTTYRPIAGFNGTSANWATSSRMEVRSAGSAATSRLLERESVRTSGRRAFATSPGMSA